MGDKLKTMKAKKKPIELHPVKNRSIFQSMLRDLWLGESPKLVRKKPFTGLLNNSTIKRNITNRIKKVINISDSIKIGVMGDTSVRMDAKDYRANYDYVIQIYKTKSREFARNLEVTLIKKFKKEHPDKVDNKSTSRAGRLTTYTGYYYIYVVFNKI